jgi:uncharacterized protein with HEPN domain
MKRDYRDYFNDILDSMVKIEKFTKGYDLQRFIADDKTQFAVVKALEIIGEAVKKIPATVKKKYPEIPWHKISGMRDKLVHEYFGINIKVVWRTIKDDIPPLKPLITTIIESLKKNQHSP